MSDATKPLDPLAAFVADEKKVQAFRDECGPFAHNGPVWQAVCVNCRYEAIVRDREAKLAELRDRDALIHRYYGLLEEKAAVEAMLRQVETLPETWRARGNEMMDHAAYELDAILRPSTTELPKTPVLESASGGSRSDNASDQSDVIPPGNTTRPSTTTASEEP